MALHRDIYWIGRQWSVTGYGLQLIDQRLKGVFDIEVARLRDKRALDAIWAQDWLKAEDFAKAIAAAHKRFPEPARPCPDEQDKPALPVETILQLSEPVSPTPPNSLTPAICPSPALELRTESELAKAELPSRAALALETLLRLSEAVAPAPSNSPVPANLLAPALEFRAESDVATSELQSPAILVETLLGPSEPVAPASAKLPLSNLELRRESERARADLQSKMSALDGLLRSRGFVTARPVMPQPSIPAVQAEGELAKFAPQWRVRS